MENNYYGSLELLVLAIYLIGIVYCAVAGADTEMGWFNFLFIAIFFTPFIALICIFSSASKKTMQQTDRLIKQNDEIIALMKSKSSE